MQRENLVSNNDDPTDYSGNRVIELITSGVSCLLSAGIFYYGLYNDYLDQFRGLELVAAKNLTSLGDHLSAFLGTGAFNLIYAVIAWWYLWVLFDYLINLTLFKNNQLLRRIGYYLIDEDVQLIADESPDRDHLLALYKQWKYVPNLKLLKQFTPTNNDEEAIKAQIKHGFHLRIISMLIVGVAVIFGVFVFFELLFPDYF